jgi:hypothetical protein
MVNTVSIAVILRVSMTIGGETMAKLIIKGNKQYIRRMDAHLRKEHPATRTRMVMRLGNKRK